jgi:predicted HTH transcriptional regulator
MNEKIAKLRREGEGLTIEFKRCHDKLSHSVYETVCSFSNRYGGDMLIGVEDDGTIMGVSRAAVKQLKKDFANALNNPQIFSPTLFIELEEVEIEGKVILYCHIPLTSQLQMYNRKIFDRNEDGDYDVTQNTELAGLILDRKRGLSSENRIFPHITADDLLLSELMPKVRAMSTMRIAEPLSLIGASNNADASDKMSDKPEASDKSTRGRLLEYLCGNGEVTAAEAAVIVDRATSTARRLLTELVVEGLAVTTGANRNRKYRAVK